MKTLKIKDGYKTFTIRETEGAFLTISRDKWDPYLKLDDYRTYSINRRDLAKMLDVLMNVSEQTANK